MLIAYGPLLAPLILLQATPKLSRRPKESAWHKAESLCSFSIGCHCHTCNVSLSNVQAHLKADRYFSVVANMRGKSAEEVAGKINTHPVLGGLQVSLLTGRLHQIILDQKVSYMTTQNPWSSVHRQSLNSGHSGLEPSALYNY